MGYKLDEKDIKFTTKRITKIGTGINGDVYKYRNMALKVFKKDKKPPIDEYTADYLTTISTDRILLPVNLLFYNNSFRGYTYKLVSKKGTGQRMIMLPKTSLIQDIRVLEKDIEILSNKQILLNGIEPANSIFNGNLYITDPTNYRVLEGLDSLELEKLNKYQLHLLLTSIITSELRKNNFSSKVEKEVKELFDMKNAEDNSSDFFGDIIGNNDSVKQFVKKMQ
ncbi:MAG: hypothetical protein IJ097_00145 [Bacilli bacterium]|nr:hypothetical protein [Bacilli bacterium]